MESASTASSFLIKYHWGGVFVRDPLSYDYEILSEIPNVDIVSLDLPGFINFCKLNLLVLSSLCFIWCLD